MTTAPAQHVIIVGAGLAGALLACALGRQGFQVSVYERRGDPRVKGFVGGRSINLALSTRGLAALKELGLDEVVLADAVRMPGRMIHDRQGRTMFQPYSRDPRDAINSVSRGGLNLTLIRAAAECPGVSLHFSHRCIDIDPSEPSVSFHDETTNQPVTATGDFIIGADGAFSAVRGWMQKSDRFDYSQSYLAHGYKELTIPPNPGAGREGGFAMEPNALHIWPRGGSMMIALPNRDGSFTCTLFWPFEGEHGFSAIRSRAQVRPFFERHYPDAVPLMPTLDDDFERNPTSSLVTVRCSPWHLGDRVVLVGDAAHAIVPFFGQGMNAAFEDCSLLVRLLREYPTDRAAAFERYFRERKPNADAIADLALENFIEMRDRTASRLFHARKKLEHALHGLFPGWYMPLYNMVSFTTIPYAQARDRARAQWRVIGMAGGVIGLGLLAGIAALLRHLP